MRKRLFNLVGITFLCLLTACSEEFSSTPVKEVKVTLCNFDYESEDLTRTSYTLGTSGYEATWTAGDIIGIYPVGGDQVAFPISDGAGGSVAVFDGGAWALRGTYSYAAYYPFNKDNYTLSEREIPIAYAGQLQSGNNTFSHFSTYDYMASQATQPNSNGSVNLDMKHLGCFFLMKLTMPKAGTYTKVTLTSDNKEFTVDGTLDLTQSTPTVTSKTTSKTVSIDLNNIVLASSNELLTVNFLMAPKDMTGSTITISVTDSNGNIYVNTNDKNITGKEYLANKTYSFTRTMISTGTGAEIEGGGGFEEEEQPNMVNGHEYVDLGLTTTGGKPIYWATCNIGAEQPENYGMFFSWGVTEEDPYHNWGGYKWTMPGYADGYYITKYTSRDMIYKGIWYDGNNQFIGDNKTKLDFEDDAACVNWGGAWRMPTKSEIEKLISDCTWTWTTRNGFKGHLVEGKNGNTIFIPAAGYCKDGEWLPSNNEGYYWSSSLVTAQTYSAYCLNTSPFSGAGVAFSSSKLRCYGFPIRPVCVLSE